MATYYVDFAVTGTGQTGTEYDPFGWNEFSASWGSNTYYIRGTYYYVGAGSVSYFGGNNDTVYAWDLDKYGPWRLSASNTTTVYDVRADINDGIWEIDVTSSIFRAIHNCYVYTAIQNGTTNLDFNDSTIIVPGHQIPTNPNVISGCILDTGGTFALQSNVSATIENTITDRLSLSGSTPVFTTAGGSGQAAIDLGGNVYSATFSAAPSFTETDLTEFRLGVSTTSAFGPSWSQGRTKFWVSFDLTSTAGLGYENDPYGWNEFSASWGGGKEYYIKGSIVEPLVKIGGVDYIGNGADTWYAWDMDKYGPWRFQPASNPDWHQFDAELHEGIIDSSFTDTVFGDVYDCAVEVNWRSSIGNFDFYDCTFVGTDSVILGGTVNTLSGCIAKTTSSYGLGQNDTGRILDSVTNRLAVSGGGSPFYSQAAAPPQYYDGTGTVYGETLNNWPGLYEQELSAYALGVSLTSGFGPYWLSATPALYVNLDTSAVAGDGSSSNPYNYTQFADFGQGSKNQYILDVGLSATFRLKGETTLSGTNRKVLFPGTTTTVTSWEPLSAYGPWRFHNTISAVDADSAVEFGAKTIRNGIIYTSGATEDVNTEIYFFTKEMENLFVLGNPTFASYWYDRGILYCFQPYCGVEDGEDIDIKGSTILSMQSSAYGGFGYDLRSNFNFDIKDDVIIVSAFTDRNTNGAGTNAQTSAISAVIQHTVNYESDVNTISGDINDISGGPGNQFDWTPPTFPTWDGDRDEYKFETFGAGITISGSGDW